MKQNRKPPVLPQNDLQLNRISHNWLMKARAQGEAHPHHLHLLSLAWWGMENEVEGDWPASDRAALKEQVSLLFAWKAPNVMAWLLSNPNGPDKDEQAASLLELLQTADSARSAAAHVLSAIYSRQQSQITALQPAASELR
jgi:hypothetical protein